MYITGESQDSINQAKKKLHELVINTKCYVKNVNVSAHKIDSILLDRLDKVRKVMETNGSYVLFPQLGSQRGLIRVQGTEILHVERTVREIMALVKIRHKGSSSANVLVGGSVLRCILVAPPAEQRRREWHASSFAGRYSNDALRYLHQFRRRCRLR